MKETIVFFTALLLLGTLKAQSSKAPPLTILALGDSITAGAGHFTCYRQVLVPELTKTHPELKFIGPKKDKTSAHAGYGGRSTANLLSMTQEIYSKYPADIVLLHSGHNSFAKDKPVSKIIADTRKIVETMHKINPGVTVLLAQVITAGKLPKYSYIPELNERIADLSKHLIEDGHHIVLVDQAEGFDWKTNTVKDKVHPNESGAKKMADKWMKALEPLLKKDFQ